MSIATLTKNERCLTPYHHIDPGFINPRLCFSTFGAEFIQDFEQRCTDGRDHLRALANDHLLVHLALVWCRDCGVESLGQVLVSPETGKLFCSTEILEGNKAVYEQEHVRNRVNLSFDSEFEVFLEYHTKHLVSDTGKLVQSRKSTVSIIGGIESVNGQEILARPLIMGAPSYDYPINKNLNSKLLWFGWVLYEIFAQDIEQFSKLEEIQCNDEDWVKVMRSVSEKEVKQFLCDILGDVPKKDWVENRMIILQHL